MRGGLYPTSHPYFLKMKLYKFNNNRKKTLNNHSNSSSGPIIYLMSRDQRVSDNQALVYSLNQAIAKKAPLYVLFVLRNDIPRANKRHYSFMIGGLKEINKKLSELNINFDLKIGTHEKVGYEYIKKIKASMVVVDFSPTRGGRKWRIDLVNKLKIPIYEIDAHNIVPAWIVSDKQEYSAYTFRRKINNRLKEYLEPIQKLESYDPKFLQDIVINWKEIEEQISKLEGSNIDWPKNGEVAALSELDTFIKERINNYDSHRNSPDNPALSNLSPFLHFGQLSANLVVQKILRSSAPKESKDTFLEQLIVRKELSDNYCLYNNNYDNFVGFPNWAKITLNEHRDDKREYLYTDMKFENADTHDDLWNAAQIEMMKTGKMHGYMRMYWAKKILEWSKSPEEAQYTAIYLNDKYSLDGRDPNGYTGIAWAIGGVHDRPWPERKIFGKIRYMNYNGAKRKFDVQKYIDNINNL